MPWIKKPNVYMTRPKTRVSFAGRRMIFFIRESYKNARRFSRTYRAKYV